jgi:prepilin signal peptidase PulO-like enzyme (type II secretory pathway)
MQFILELAFFFFGAMLASFAGVVSERIYTGQSWLRGRSKCNSCRRTLDALDLVPVVSWVVFRGRCRTCRAHVPATYAVIEAMLGILFVVSYLTLGLTVSLEAFLAALAMLTFIVLYDIRHTIVPWESSLLLFIFSLCFALLQMKSIKSFESILFTACVIAIGFFLLYFFSRGRAMGLGDAPVAFSLSLLVGTAAIPGILFSFWIGAIIGILFLVFRRGGPKMGIEVPFVPFMAIGYLLAFFTQWNPLL